MAATGVSKRGGRYFVADDPSNVICFCANTRYSVHIFPKDETVGRKSFVQRHGADFICCPLYAQHILCPPAFNGILAFLRGNISGKGFRRFLKKGHIPNFNVAGTATKPDRITKSTGAQAKQLKVVVRSVFRHLR